MPHVDGQLVISHDILGSFVGDIKPKFVKRYADLDQVIEGAFRSYADEVRTRRFPGPEHAYPIGTEEEVAIQQRRNVLAGGTT